jgi:hypothetical protein
MRMEREKSIKMDYTQKTNEFSCVSNEGTKLGFL